MSELTDYEKERLERIAKNRELLQSLQIDKQSRVSRDGTPELKKSKSKKAPQARRKPEPVDPALRIRTRSSRARTASLASRDPEAAKRKLEEEEEQERQALLAKKKAKHDQRDIECWNPSGRFVLEQAALPLRQMLQSVAGSGTWRRPVPKSLIEEEDEDPKTPVTTSKRAKPAETNSRTRGSATKKRPTKEESDSDVDYADERRQKINTKSLSKTFEGMSMKAVKKITPDRVYSLAVHPTVDKDLVFVGDRKGWLGIWNASADAEEDLKDEEDEEDEFDRHAFVQRVYNDHGTISCLKLDPLKSHTVYTSSYDCTVRALNFEVGIWEEQVDVDLQAADYEGEGEALISAFEITHDGHTIWLSDNRGGVMHADLRESKKRHRRWRIAENKAGCISLNPANENIFATAHLNHDVRIWDARMLQSLNPAKTDHKKAFRDACIASHESSKAVSSAYFDPSGQHIVSTCYDDRLRIWNVDPGNMTSDSLGEFEPDKSVYHDNNTGAYTSVFKATWASNPIADPYFTIGNMKRTLDIYDKQGKLITQLADGLSSVPAVTCSHLTQPVIFAGAAGGKTYYWRADKWA